MRWALASLSLSMLLSSLGTSIANVGLPTFAEAFDASFQQVQWVVVAYLLAITASIVVVGWLGDLTGRRRLMLTGVLLFTAASALCGASRVLWLLVAARAAQGIGAAVMMALTLAFVSETVATARTGRAMGLLGTTSAVGTALGPSLGGVLIAAFGWPALFFVNVPLGLLVLGLAYRHLPAGRPAAAPSIRLAMLHDRALRGGLTMSTLVSTVVMTTLVVGPFYLSRVFGLDTAMVGLVLSAGPLVSALSGVPSGRFVDRYGAERMARTGLTGMVVGTSLLALLPAAVGLTGYVGSIVVLTAGYALFQAANNTAVMHDVSPDRRGLVAGLLTLSRNIGLTAGASVMGAVFAGASGAKDVATADPAAVAAGLRGTFAVATVLVLIARVVAHPRRAVERPEERLELT
jgi:MFS family permease